MSCRRSTASTESAAICLRGLPRILARNASPATPEYSIDVTAIRWVCSIESDQIPIRKLAKTILPLSAWLGGMRNPACRPERCFRTIARAGGAALPYYARSERLRWLSEVFSLRFLPSARFHTMMLKTGVKPEQGRACQRIPPPGSRIPDPLLVETTGGSTPRMKAIEVIRIGRSRNRQASITASSRFWAVALKSALSRPCAHAQDCASTQSRHNAGPAGAPRRLR